VNGGAHIDFEKYERSLIEDPTTKDIGKITQVTGFLLQGYLSGAVLGSLCEIQALNGAQAFRAEVVGFRDNHVLLMPLGEIRGVGLGSRILLLRSRAMMRVGGDLLGRVIDALGEPLDGKGPIKGRDEVSLYSSTYNPLGRPPISEPLSLGVRALDGLLTVGRGQRVGIMAGSGVGKSVLLGMMAKNSNADVNVIALIGERGREVREFLENVLGEEGLQRSVVIVATSDQSALERVRAAFVATAVANYFCAQNKHVLLMMDSVTRFAMAQREIGLNGGEPPTTKGYTPSVFAMLPKLMERAGTFENSGTITGLFTVLVEGDDMDDPIGDAVRSITDGHIVLDRGLAQRGHFPAIDILRSTSRVMNQVVGESHKLEARAFREMLATYRQAEDLINIGAYKQGSNPRIDRAVALYEPMESYLRQDVSEPSDIQSAQQQLQRIIGF
jgi:flagellum-specific ATP synthase